MRDENTDCKIFASGAMIMVDAFLRILDARINSESNITAAEKLKQVKKEALEMKNLAELGRVNEIISAWRF